MSDEEKTEAKPKRTSKKKKTTGEEMDEYPRTLWGLSTGQKILLKDGETAVVSKVDWRKRPTEIEVRVEGKVQKQEFKLENFLRLR